MITYGFHAAPPALKCEPTPLPGKGLVTLTEVICFATYNSALTAEQLERELDDVQARGGDEWGSEEMRSSIARAYEALSDCLDSGEVTLRGILVDQSSPAERRRTAAQAQRTAIEYPDCGDLIHELCGNVLYQQSTLDNSDIDDVRTWQDVAMSARDAQAMLDWFIARGNDAQVPANMDCSSAASFALEKTSADPAPRRGRGRPRSKEAIEAYAKKRWPDFEPGRLPAEVRPQDFRRIVQNLMREAGITNPPIDETFSKYGY